MDGVGRRWTAPRFDCPGHSRPCTRHPGTGESEPGSTGHPSAGRAGDGQDARSGLVPACRAAPRGRSHRSAAATCRGRASDLRRPARAAPAAGGRRRNRRTPKPGGRAIARRTRCQSCGERRWSLPCRHRHVLHHRLGQGHPTGWRDATGRLACHRGKRGRRARRIHPHDPVSHRQGAWHVPVRRRYLSASHQSAPFFGLLPTSSR